MTNRYCIVNYFHIEATGKSQDCEKCPLAERCNKYQIAKKFTERNKDENTRKR